jgi:hypothetical protein
MEERAKLMKEEKKETPASIWCVYIIFSLQRKTAFLLSLDKEFP